MAMLTHSTSNPTLGATYRLAVTTASTMPVRTVTIARPSLTTQLMSNQQEVDLVWLDHCYAKPWSTHPDASNAKPVRMLFMAKYPRKTHGLDNIREPDMEIDIETIAPATPLPYDVNKGRMVMNECERHINFARLEEINEEWEERIATLRTGWTSQQNRLFHKVIKALYADRLARLTYEGHLNEPVQRRIHVDKTARRIRHALAGVQWETNMTQWLHGVLIDNLSQKLLAAYLDVIQVLKSKIPGLVEKMISVSTIKCPATTVEALSLLLKRPWDPTISTLQHHKLKKLPGNPLLVVIPSGPAGLGPSQGHTRRTRMWQTQLSHLGKVIQVIVHSNPAASVAQCLENMISTTRSKVIELRGQSPNRPIILIGWNVGALVACHVSLIEHVTASVCMGFPLTSISGAKGDIDDTLLENKTPTLFIIGQFSETCRLDDLEDMRERMKAENSLLVVGGADGNLRLTRAKKKLEGLTQTVVDRCIQEEIAEFLGSILAQSNSSMYPDGGEGDRRKHARRRKSPKEPIQRSMPLPHSSSSSIQKISSRHRTPSLGYFEHLLKDDEDQSQMNLSRSLDSRMVAMGLDPQKAMLQAKKSATKRKRSPSLASTSAPKRRYQRSMGSVDSAQSMASKSLTGMSSTGMVGSGLTAAMELTGLLTGHITPQHYVHPQSTPASMAVLQNALALRQSTAASSALQQRLPQGLGLSISSPSSVAPPGLIPQQASHSQNTVQSLSQRLALSASNYQDRMKTTTPFTQTPPNTPGPSSINPQLSHRTSPIIPSAKSHSLGTAVTRTVASSLNPIEQSAMLSPIKSALAAGPLPPRSAPFASATSQIQNLLTSMVRQSSQHGLSSLSSGYPGTSSHSLNPTALLGLEAHQQLQYAASVAAATRLSHATTTAPTLQQPTIKLTMPTALPAEPPPNKIVSTTQTLQQPSAKSQPLTTTDAQQSEQERVLAIQKLQFHDFPLTTATISKTTGATHITQARILTDKQLDLSKIQSENVTSKAEMSPKIPATIVPITSVAGNTVVTFTSITKPSTTSTVSAPHTLTSIASTNAPSTQGSTNSSTINFTILNNKTQPSAKTPLIKTTETLGHMPSVLDTSAKKTVVLSRPPTISAMVNNPNVTSTTITLSMNTPKATTVISSSTLSGLISKDTSLSCPSLSLQGTNKQKATTVISISTAQSVPKKPDIIDDDDCPGEVNPTSATLKTALPTVTSTRSRRIKTPKQFDA